MLSSCDIQMITGIGILISAYATLGGPSGISAYHWEIAVYLAWFANMTPLLGLTFLRRYLQLYPFQRSWRLVVMAILFILLLVALLPTAYFDWDMAWPIAEPGFFARCFFDQDFIKERSGPGKRDFGVAGAIMILSMIVLVFTCTTRMIKMSRRTARHMQQNVRGRARKVGIRMINHISKGLLTPTKHPRIDALRISLVFQPLASLFLTARLYADFYASTGSDIWWAWATAAWVTIRVLQSKTSELVEVEEGDLTFGQCMAVLLLIAPAATAGVTLWQIFPQWIQRQRGRNGRSADISTPSQRLSEDEGSRGTVNHGIHDGCDIPSHQLMVRTSQDMPSGNRRVRHILDLITCSSKSYAQPWSNAVIALLWSQTWLATLAFLYMAGTSFELAGSSVSFLMYGSIPTCLQPLNCSLLTLLGMRKMTLGEQETGKKMPREGWCSWSALDWLESIWAWTILVLGLLILLFFNLPFLLWVVVPYQPLVCVSPWILYFIYAFIESIIAPAR